MNMNTYNNNSMLIRFIILLLIVASMFIIYQMTYRSVWLDEAMLLENILDTKSFSNFISPLPYYNQAEPFMASIFFKFTTNYISENFQIIRLFIALLFVISLFPLLAIFKKNVFGQLVLILIIFANLSTLGFYFTEIKHYPLEIFSSSFMLYAIYLYNQTSKLICPVLIVLGSMILGFSTLIPAIVILSYIFLLEYNKGKTLFRKDILLMLGFSLLIVLSTYIHMKFLTVYQLNINVYFSKGFMSDLESLKSVTIDTYGKFFFILSAISTIYAFFVQRTSFLFRLNIIFLVVVFVIILGKVTGVYPVISIRHLVWLLPFSIVIASLTILDSLKQDNVYKYLGYLFIVGLVFKSLTISYNAYNKEIFEYTANNKLYEYVSKMDKSIIVVHYLAQPSFQYYSRIIPSLKKHTYYNLRNPKSRHHNFQGEKLYSTVLNNTFYIPNKEFYYLISHESDIEDTNNHTYRSDQLRNKFKENGCNYASIFNDKSVQLLKVSCNKNGTINDYQ